MLVSEFQIREKNFILYWMTILLLKIGGAFQFFECWASFLHQESQKGHCRIPIASELHCDAESTWLCITRANSHSVKEDSATITEGTPRAFHTAFEASTMLLGQGGW